MAARALQRGGSSAPERPPEGRGPRAILSLQRGQRCGHRSVGVKHPERGASRALVVARRQRCGKHPDRGADIRVRHGIVLATRDAWIAALEAETAEQWAAVVRLGADALDAEVAL